MRPFGEWRSGPEVLEREQVEQVEIGSAVRFRLKSKLPQDWEMSRNAGKGDGELFAGGQPIGLLVDVNFGPDGPRRI
jgi:hypothetical protein